MTTKAFEEKEREFLRECFNVPTNYDNLQAMLDDGVNINAENPNEYDPISILGNVITDFVFYIDCEINGDCEPEKYDIECTECEHHIKDHFYVGEELFKLVRFFIKNGFDIVKYGDECLSYLCYLLGSG